MKKTIQFSGLLLPFSLSECVEMGSTQTTVKEKRLNEAVSSTVASAARLTSVGLNKLFVQKEKSVIFEMVKNGTKC